MSNKSEGHIPDYDSVKKNEEHDDQEQPQRSNPAQEFRQNNNFFREETIQSKSEDRNKNSFLISQIQARPTYNN